MSKSKLTLAGLALASLAVTSNAIGQQPGAQQPGAQQPGTQQPGVQQPGAQQPTPAQRANENPNVPGQQTDRQTPPVQTQQDQRLMGNMQGVPLAEALVRKMKKSGEGEIELAQLAKEKVEDQGFREFTQMIIDDHQALNQQLDKLVSTGARGGQASGGSSAQNREGNIATPTPQQGQQQQNRDPSQGDNNRAGAQDQQRNAQRGQAGDAARSTEGQAGQQAGQQPGQPGQGQGIGREAQMAGRGGSVVPQQLCAIMEQACENNVQMTKKMLQEHQGQDFQMAYLGQQIVAHTAAMAELQAIESAGPPELKAVAQQATPKIQEHLEMAKKLAKKFEDDRGSSSRSGQKQQEGSERR